MARSTQFAAACLLVGARALGTLRLPEHACGNRSCADEWLEDAAEGLAHAARTANLSAPLEGARAHFALEHRRRSAAEDDGARAHWWRRRLRAGDKPADTSEEDTPLYQGIGTHYANIYVGTPPQRVSVIVDTGSHHTAFPCKGCKQCGKHTDPYFDPDVSSSLTRIGCGNCLSGARCNAKQCQLSQSYTEGSSWKAFQVRDKLWVGGVSATDRETGPGLAGEAFATDFVFGCQFYETGLFRTQKADGIMGMSSNAATLVPQLHGSGKIKHRAFSLCFRNGGGNFALGGVDASHHTQKMTFVPLAKVNGWFTVKLVDVLIGGESIGVKATVWNSGKGTIVDSGTTDTYLPKRSSDQFKKRWESIVGRKYGNTKMELDAATVKKLPVVTFVFEENVAVEVQPGAYMEKAGGKYVPRIYLTEGSGAVLGGNFMQDHDVFFDAENRRVGFAEADCAYKTHET